jgi:sec-independent protein translocase protein TatC
MEKMPEDEVRPGVDDEGDGGPVKSFLDHLEDLRWMLVKSVVAIVLGMLVCMVAGNKLVQFLTWPLEHARGVRPIPKEVPLLLGTNVLGRLSAPALAEATGNTNPVTALHLTPVMLGTNVILAVEPDTNIVRFAARNIPTLKNYTPLGGIMVALKLAIYGGLILSSPFLFYFIGSFVLPALKVREKKILYRAVAFGSVLFFLGVAFCYFVLAGVALIATVEFSQWLGFGADEWRAEEYISFMCQFMLGMGLGFELPVVILTLVKIGLIGYDGLTKFRRYAIVANLVIAAIATPSADPFTMFLMAIPLHLLYELSVLVAWYWQWRDRKRALNPAQN